MNSNNHFFSWIPWESVPYLHLWSIVVPWNYLLIHNATTAALNCISPHKKHPHAHNSSLDMWLYMLSTPSRMLACWNQRWCGRGGLILPSLPISALCISVPTSSRKRTPRPMITGTADVSSSSGTAIQQMYAGWCNCYSEEMGCERDSHNGSVVWLMTQLFIWKR